MNLLILAHFKRRNNTKISSNIPLGNFLFR